MKYQTLIVSLAAASCALADHQDVAVEQKDQPTSSMGGHGSPWDPVNTPNWVATVSPEKISKLQSDMHNLATSVRGNKLFTSMTAVMATAIPESFKDAMATNPQSIHQQYKTATPDWYKAIPSDIRKFMEENKKAAKSIFSKDIGPMPTGNKAHATKTGDHQAQETGKKKDGKVGEKSEAGSLSMMGATSAALIGTFGFALMLL